MAKIRIHELAKELDISSKDIITRLATLGVEVKNHMSTVEPEDIDRLKSTLRVKPQTENANPETRRPAGPVNTAGRTEGQRPESFQGQRPQGPRPEGFQGQRPQGPRPEGFQGQRPQGPRPEGFQGQRPQGPRPEGFQGQRPQGPRPEGFQGQRPQGPRPEGFQGQRPEGFQGQRPQGPRPGGYQGQQGQRPDGFQGQQRPPYGGGGPRPSGAPAGRPPRPGMAGPQGARGGRPGLPPIPAPPQAVGQDQTTQRPRFDSKKGGKTQPDRRDSRDKRETEDRLLKRAKGKHARGPVRDIHESAPKHIVIPEIITVQDLASIMSRKSSELIVKLMALGVMATINQEIDAETATLIAHEFGIEVEVKIEKPAGIVEEIVDAPESLATRPPVVTVMGHVDHGKTSLLDAIRTTNVIAREAGGITQHIGAYQVEIKGQKITFLDTPGHEAFTAMRARGAQVTDIAILVVAADDGVMPQTVEAINHAKAAGVPIIVAINKIDKENALPERVKQELTEYGLVAEEWGGDTIMVPVSAKAKQNIEGLLEMILLVSEVQDLKANPNRKAYGTVVEAQLDKGRGPVATVLVQKGALEVGDILVAGATSGKVRAMIDDKGRRIKKAGPSTPVEVLGLSEVPMAGDIFNAVEDDKTAKAVVTYRQGEKKAEDAKRNVKVSLEDLFDKIKEGQVKELNVIIKADVQGSIEALRQSLERLSTGEVRVNPIHGGVGAITETDVMLAAASNAIIIGFNVRPDANTKNTAERQGVDIRLYRVIYDAIEDVKAAMSGLLDPDFKETVMGHAEVRATFKVPKAGTIAGCFVTDGKITRNSEIRVIRDGIVILEGKLESLRRFKDDAKEVATGYECGIGIEKFNDFKEGDIVEAFMMEEVKREL